MRSAPLDTSRRRRHLIVAVVAALAAAGVAARPGLADSGQGPASAAATQTGPSPAPTAPAPQATVTSPAPPAPATTAAAPPPPTTTSATPTITAPTAATVAPPPPPAAAGSVVGASNAVAPHGAAHTSAARHQPRAHAAGASAVTIRDFSFGPSTVTVHVGDTVTWSNDGPSAHTATGAGFDTGVLGKGRSGSHTFTSAGTFSYHCTIHPFMKGTVVVVAAAAGGGGTSGGSAAPRGGAAPSASTGANGGAGPATSTAGASSSTLPHTGLNALAVAALGVVLLACGVALRAVTRRG